MLKILPVYGKFPYLVKLSIFIAFHYHCTVDQIEILDEVFILWFFHMTEMNFTFSELPTHRGEFFNVLQSYSAWSRENNILSVHPSGELPPACRSLFCSLAR